MTPSLRARALACLALAATLILVAACGPKPPPPSGKGGGNGEAAASAPRIIGFAGPLTGDNAQFGLQLRSGAELALDELNARGGVKGSKVQGAFEDDVANPREAASVAQKLAMGSTSSTGASVPLVTMAPLCHRSCQR